MAFNLNKFLDSLARDLLRRAPYADESSRAMREVAYAIIDAAKEQGMEIVIDEPNPDAGDSLHERPTPAEDSTPKGRSVSGLDKVTSMRGHRSDFS